MSGGTIGRCPKCGRLIIYGQKCTCHKPPTAFLVRILPVGDGSEQ